VGEQAAPPRSLCLSCVFVKEVRGRRGQTYLLCRNANIPDKYPRQPVIRCSGYVQPP
jgi:hypothetical protein